MGLNQERYLFVRLLALEQIDLMETEPVQDKPQLMWSSLKACAYGHSSIKKNSSRTMTEAKQTLDCSVTR